jgi:dienelactone hydrolase
VGRSGRAIAGTALAVAVGVGALGGDALGTTGRQAHEVVRIDLVDPSRPTAAGPGVAASTTRALPTTVHLPTATDPAPLIVLAHGAAGGPEKFGELAAAWADAGYVVAAPRFPLTNQDVLPPVIGDLGEQSNDVRFVIDALTTGALADRIDAERIGLFGLSLGALTVWGEALGPVPDGRIDALIQSDGATLVDDVATVPFPVLVAHSDIDPIFPYGDVVADYDALPGPKYLLTLHGAVHATVGEDTVTAADVAYRQATTAFWDRTLRGLATPLPDSIEGVATVVEGTRREVLPGSR